MLGYLVIGLLVLGFGLCMALCLWADANQYSPSHRKAVSDLDPFGVTLLITCLFGCWDSLLEWWEDLPI